MPKSICQIYVHIIFSTKNREPWFLELIRARVHGYMAGLLRKRGCFEVLVGGYVDHVHCLCLLNKMETVPSLVQFLKQDLSKFVKTLDEHLRAFAWQNGYGLFSVSPTHVSVVQKYIENQQEHHCGKTFQEEYRQFLRKYKIECDEKYLWD